MQFKGLKTTESFKKRRGDLFSVLEDCCVSHELPDLLGGGCASRLCNPTNQLISLRYSLTAVNAQKKGIDHRFSSVSAMGR